MHTVKLGPAPWHPYLKYRLFGFIGRQWVTLYYVSAAEAMQEAAISGWTVEGATPHASVCDTVMN
jgi:hypothetical protein